MLALWQDAGLSTRRDMPAVARSRLGAPFIDRHIAVVDPLLVHPFPAEALLSGQRSRGGCRARGRLANPRGVLSIRRQHDADCKECSRYSEQRPHGWPRKGLVFGAAET